MSLPRNKSGRGRDLIPKGKQVTVCLSISLDDLAILDERARAHGVERSSFVRRLIRDGYIATCSVCRERSSVCKCGEKSAPAPELAP